MKKKYALSVTTQGPAYPPSEVMDENGDFVVLGYINAPGGQRDWGAAIVDVNSEIPEFGRQSPYTVKRDLNLEAIADGREQDFVLYTLPLPLPCNNYPMEFAPEQRRAVNEITRERQPLHLAPIPDERPEDGRRVRLPVTIRQWLKARGELEVSVSPGAGEAVFDFVFEGLIPDSLYTVMALREHDLDPAGPTRPGPLGIPNVFLADDEGRARYRAVMPNAFPRAPGGNRIINIVVLWMSTQMSYGGAIGYHGLGGDVHAQLKLKVPSFSEFSTAKGI